MARIISKENIEKFDNSEIGKIKNHYLKRAKIIGIIAIMVSLIYIIINILYSSSWQEYISPILLIIFGIYFIIKSNKIKTEEINKYIYNEKNKKK